MRVQNWYDWKLNRGHRWGRGGAWGGGWGSDRGKGRGRAGQGYQCTHSKAKCQPAIQPAVLQQQQTLCWLCRAIQIDSTLWQQSRNI